MHKRYNIKEYIRQIKKNFDMEKLKKSVSYQQNKMIIDGTSGEILEEEKTVQFKVEQEPDFVKLYLRDLSLVIGLPSTAQDIMHLLLRFMTYDNRIILNSAIRKEISENLKVKPNTLAHRLADLCSANIMLKKDTNLYMVNPYLFGRGKWEDIKKLRLTIDYEPTQRLIRTAVLKEEQQPDNLEELFDVCSRYDAAKKVIQD